MERTLPIVGKASRGKLLCRFLEPAKHGGHFQVDQFAKTLELRVCVNVAVHGPAARITLISFETCFQAGPFRGAREPGWKRSSLSERRQGCAKIPDVSFQASFIAFQGALLITGTRN